MNSMAEAVDTIEADVLILGTGLAGLRAAIEARRYGVGVLLVDKSLIGVNSNTRFSGSAFRAASSAGIGGTGGAAAEVVTLHSYPSEHFKDTLRIGGFLNDQRLAEILCFEVPARVHELADFGLKNLSEMFLHCCYPHGTLTVRSLLETIEKMECRTIRRLYPLELLKQDNTVVGAVCINLDTGRLAAIKAKTTILATGGAGEVFERNETASTVTGDGYAIAYEAGAQLMDMEMVHFEPYVHAEPDLPMMDRHESSAGCRGVLRNKFGEDFLPKYIQAVGPAEAPFHFTRHFGISNVDIRWVVSRAMAMEVREGRGDNGAVFYDLTQVPEDVWQTGMVSKYLRYVLCRGYDVTKTSIRVFPAAITTLGGVRINEDCQTTLDGLYAAGEVTGGVHGAMRLGGNALADCLVFGARAGGSAAKRALSVPMPALNARLMETPMRTIRDVLNRQASGDGAPEGIKKQIRSVTWKHVGVLRDREGLEEAISVLDQLRNERLPKVFAGSLSKLRPALECAAMLTTARMIAASALHRRESRGGQYRLDFPAKDDAKWLRNVLVARGPDEMEVTTQPAVMTRFRPQDLPADGPIARALEGVEALNAAIVNRSGGNA